MRCRWSTSRCWLNAWSTSVTFLLLIYRSECVKDSKVAVSWGTFIQSGFTKLWQSRWSLSFFIEGIKSHCGMWVFRGSTWTRLNTIDNWCNFGPQLLSIIYCRIYLKYLKTFSNRVFENIRNLTYFQIFEISNVFKYFEMFWNIPNLKCFEIFEIWNVFKYLKFQIFSNILKYLKFRIFQNIWNFKYFQIADFKMFSNIWNRFYSINLAQNFSASKRSKRKRLKSL